MVCLRTNFSATIFTIEHKNHSLSESLEQEADLSKVKWFWGKISLEDILLCPSNYFIFHHLFKMNQLFLFDSTKYKCRKQEKRPQKSIQRCKVAWVHLQMSIHFLNITNKYPKYTFMTSCYHSPYPQSKESFISITNTFQ